MCLKFNKEGDMADLKKETSGGSSFLSLLAVAFIVLKVLHKVEWSWWWVTSPIWIPAAIIVVVAVTANIIKQARG